MVRILPEINGSRAPSKAPKKKKKKKKRRQKKKEWNEWSGTRLIVREREKL